MANMQYGYVTLMNKPWGFASYEDFQIDAGCHLLLYHGDFSIADFAAMVKPLGAGEMTTLPVSAGAEGCLEGNEQSRTQSDEGISATRRGQEFTHQKRIQSTVKAFKVR